MGESLKNLNARLKMLDDRMGIGFEGLSIVNFPKIGNGSPAMSEANFGKKDRGSRITLGRENAYGKDGLYAGEVSSVKAEKHALDGGRLPSRDKLPSIGQGTSMASQPILIENEGKSKSTDKGVKSSDIEGYSEITQVVGKRAENDIQITDYNPTAGYKRMSSNVSHSYRDIDFQGTPDDLHDAVGKTGPDYMGHNERGDGSKSLLSGNEVGNTNTLGTSESRDENLDRFVSLDNSKQELMLDIKKKIPGKSYSGTNLVGVKKLAPEPVKKIKMASIGQLGKRTLEKSGSAVIPEAKKDTSIDQSKKRSTVAYGAGNQIAIPTKEPARKGSNLLEKSMRSINRKSVASTASLTPKQKGRDLPMIPKIPHMTS